MSDQQHIIRRFTLDLELEVSPNRAFAVNQRIKQQCLEIVNESMDGMFNQLNSDGSFVRIQKVEISLGKLHLKSLKKELPRLVWQELNKQLKEDNLTRFKGEGASVSNASQLNYTSTVGHHAQGIFFHFLEYGTFPWWAKKVNWQQWNQNLVADVSPTTREVVRRKLMRVLTQNMEARRRLIWQFPPEVVDLLIGEKGQSLLDEITQYGQDSTGSDLQNANLSNELRSSQQKSSTKSQKDHQRATDSTKTLPINHGQQKSRLTRMDDEESSSPQIHKGIEQALVYHLNDQSKAAQDWGQQQLQAGIQSVHEEIAFYIDNAGLAIILPCLSPLFQQLGFITEKRNFSNTEAQIKGIQLIQYLASGQASAPEYLMVLNKIICAWPLNQAIPKESWLSESERGAADDFLRTMIKHWGALKNTSPDGLRHNFLERNGKLTLVDKRWLLQVEQASYDTFLLKKLPWTMSIVTYRWMKQRIHVEWS